MKKNLIYTKNILIAFLAILSTIGCSFSKSSYPEGKKFAQENNELSSSKPEVYTHNNRSWRTAKLLHKLSTNGVKIVHSVAFTYDSNFMASTGFGGKVNIWNLNTLKQLKEIDTNEEQINALAFTSDDKQLVTAGIGSKIKFFDVKTGNLISDLVGDIDSIFWHLSLSSNNCIVAASSFNGATRQYLRVWNTCNKRILYNNSNSSSGIVTSDGEKLIFYDYQNNTINTVDLNNGKSLASYLSASDSISCIAISKDNKILATGEKSGNITLWSLRNLKKIGRLTASSINSQNFTTETLLIKSSSYNPIKTLVFNSDGKTLASGDNQGNIVLWDWKLKQALATLKDGNGTVFSLAFSPDGKMLVSSSTDYSIKIWQ